MIESIKTDRLILRSWKEADLPAFANLNADSRVMEYFTGTMTKEESDQFAKRIMTSMQQQGWGLWAVTIPGRCDFIGYIGLAPVNFEGDFTPAVEVGWRLAYDHWNQGYATEGARAAINYGFEKLGLQEIVSFTAVNNIRSRRVMAKIGMHHDTNGDFDHPRVPVGHVLRRHVLYRINKTSQFIHVYKTCPENFQPTCEVAACYIEVEGKLLLLERSASESEGKTWGVPAGKIEIGESSTEAALRELFEETGILASSSNISEMGTLYIQKPDVSYVYHLFQVRIDTTPPIVLNSEHTQYLWASDKEIDELPLIRGAKQALEHYKEMKKHR